MVKYSVSPNSIRVRALGARFRRKASEITGVRLFSLWSIEVDVKQQKEAGTSDNTPSFNMIESHYLLDWIVVRVPMMWNYGGDWPATIRA